MKLTMFATLSVFVFIISHNKAKSDSKVLLNETYDNREANNNFEDTADNEMEDLLINEEVTDFKDKEEDFVLTKGMYALHCLVEWAENWKISPIFCATEM